jgi:hypothetical protein
MEENVNSIKNEAAIFENRYKPGTEKIIDERKYIANTEGILLPIAKTATLKVKPVWDDVKVESVQYHTKRYDIAYVKDKRGRIKDIIVIREYVTDHNGQSKITSKTGRELPRKALSIPAEQEVLAKIADALIHILGVDDE